jgi:hypothetical protein
LGGYFPILFDTPVEYIVLGLIAIIGYLLNSTVKIPHP